MKQAALSVKTAEDLRRKVMKEIVNLLNKYRFRAWQLGFQTKNAQYRTWYEGYAEAISMVLKLLKEGIVK